MRRFLLWKHSKESYRVGNSLTSDWKRFIQSTASSWHQIWEDFYKVWQHLDIRLEKISAKPGNILTKDLRFQQSSYTDKKQKILISSGQFMFSFLQKEPIIAYACLISIQEKPICLENCLLKIWLVCNWTPLIWLLAWPVIYLNVLFMFIDISWSMLWVCENIASFMTSGCVV